MTYYNYLGQPMPETAPEQSHVSGTAAGGETIQAPDGNSSVAGAGGGDMLIGSSGDNSFFITDPGDVVVEQPGGGVDTESGYTTIRLAPNVENLVVHQDFNHGVGNALDNLIVTDGRSWLYGGAGNDVLVGATNTTTTFTEHKGEGSDVIYNWQGADRLQLVGYDFKTGADVRAAMTQHGSDVVLQLAPDETLTFRNTTVAGFQDKQFLLPLDTSKLGALTFDDEFNSLSLYDPSHKTGTWSTDFGGNLKDQSAYSIPNNGEMEIYLHDGFEGTGDGNLHINPFSISNGVLSITAQPLPTQDVSAAFGHTWSSGMLNTLGSFQQKYGYFEIHAQLPNVPGTWPAFWMVPSPYHSGQEADVMESIGLQPQNDYRFGWGSNNIDDHALKLDPNGWHTYGMLWTKDTVSFYMDGVEVLHGPTPASWTSPMGLIVNMAMGGWGGGADPSQYPASMNIDWIRAYALADGSSTVDHLTPAAPVATIQDETQPAVAPTVQTLTFDDTGQALASGKIVVLDHAPGAGDVPASGRAFVVWQEGGQVRAAEADGGHLDSPTVLMAGGTSGFDGHGTFLTDGRVVVSYMGTDAGQPAAFALIFDPSKHSFSTHELGPSSGQVSFVPLANGDFAASWHTPDGHIEGRAFDAFAYDSHGWWGPVRDLPGDAIGADAQGDLITSDGTAFAVTPYALSAPDSVSIGPATVTHAEGDSGVTTYTFTVTRSDQFWQRGTVAWKVTGLGDHPATALDFVGGEPSGVLSFQGGQDTATITVQVTGDTVVEPDEQFQVSLFHPVGTTLGATTTAVGVITNDDGGGTNPPPTAPTVSLATTAVSHAEGDSGSTAFSYTLTRSGDASAASSVHWSVAGSGAHPADAADFLGGVLPSGDVSFAAGETSKVITVSVAGDGVVENDEGFTLTLSNANGASLGSATATGTILNDDASSGGGGSGQVFTSPKVGSVETGTAGADTFNASQGNDTLTGGAGADVFAFPKEPWSPIHITDFQLGTDRLDFSAMFKAAGYTGSDPVADGYVFFESDGSGGTMIRFDHDGSGSNPVWPNSIIDLEHVSPTGLTWAELAGNGGGGTAPPPTAPTVALSTTTLSHAEGDSGSTAFSYTLTRSGDASAASSVHWSVAGSGAHPADAADFLGGVLPSGDVSFAAGETSKVITVSVAGDGVVENDEGFTLTLSNANGASLGTATATGTILNDDASSGGGGSGQVFTSPKVGSVETGTAGADTFNASQGNDTLTGGAGADVFAFPHEPWSPIHITDFQLGTDRLDFSAMFKAAGYTGSDPVADGYVFFESDGSGGTMIRFDHDGSGSNPVWPNSIIDLEHVSPTGLTWGELAGSGGGGTNPPPTAPTVALSTTTLSHAEGDSGSTAFSYTLTRSGDASAASSVHWSVAGSGAHPADAGDFLGGVLPSGDVSFAAGETSKVITVSVAGDGTVETDEGFTLTLSNANGASLGTATATGTILNDDASSGGGGSGQVFTSPKVGSVETGTAGADTFNASHGNDTLTGGAGADVFAFPHEPWSPIHITDFTPGEDKLDFTAMFKAAGYTGSDPIADGYMYVESDGSGGSMLRFDHDGSGSNPVWPNSIIDLEHVAPSQVRASDWIFG